MARIGVALFLLYDKISPISGNGEIVRLAVQTNSLTLALALRPDVSAVQECVAEGWGGSFWGRLPAALSQR